MKKYDHSKIEKKWQKEWEKAGIYRVSEETNRPKCYVLDMFPYPSGDGLHVGHPKGYIATDIYSRFKKMNGMNVLHPMGWDAFGLPAEQYAIKNKVHPSLAVEKNVARFKEQLSVIGLNYDWSHEINTTDPKYYKWTQWIFLKLLEKGLAYESYEPITWCPSCQTGLAAEDLEGDKCERCGTVVEKKPMRQWVLRITDYADRMISDLGKVDWADYVKEAQRNWIGRSEGALLKFEIRISKSETNPKAEIQNVKRAFEVFTTRPDTLFGATYCVLSPEHKVVDELKDKIENWSEVEEYRAEAKAKNEIERLAEGKEKTGVLLRGIKAVNPVNNQELPVYIADYVLAHYGTGAIMAVPAHDTRDYEFAKKFGIPMIEVIGGGDISKEAYIGPGSLVNSGNYSGMESPEAKKAITGYAGGKLTSTYKLRDWVFSRQRYWGEPIPVVHCEACGLKDWNPKYSFSFRKQSVWDKIVSGEKTIETRALNPEEPEHYFGGIEIGEVLRFVNKETGEMRPYRVKTVFRFSSIEEIAEKDAELGKRIWTDGKENHTLEEWKEGYAGLSSNYLEKIQRNGLVAFEIEPTVVTKVVPVPENELPVKLPDVEFYEPTGTGESPLANVTDWVEVKCPKCGGPGKRETNTMPQWAGSCWYYLRYIDPKNGEALVDKSKEKYWSPVDMYVGGMEHATRHLIYARFWHKFLYDIGVVNHPEPFMKLHTVGLILASDGRKMSKRWGNVVNPDEIVETYGADTLRLYEMFMGPFEQSSAWSTESIIGSRRFLEKVWGVVMRVNEMSDNLKEDTAPGYGDNAAAPVKSSGIEASYHRMLRGVALDIENFKFNTAISKMMIFINELEKEKKISKMIVFDFLKVLAPFAPHIAEELWHEIGNNSFIYEESWPMFDVSKAKEDTITIAVQVNGKVRTTFDISAEIDEEEVKNTALALRDVKKWIEGKEIKKMVYVKGKLLNIVV